MNCRGAIFVMLGLSGLGSAGQEDALPGTERLTGSEDLAARMMEGLHRFAERKIADSPSGRAQHWKRDPSSRAAYEKSIEPNRRRLAISIGVLDARVPTRLERFGDDARPALVAETDRYRAWQVRWPVLEGVTGEGLLLEPKRDPGANVIALPDADQTPEQIAGLAPGVAAECQFARRLAENGLRVLVPALVSRGNIFSGNPRIAMTNQPQREWIYRQAYHMGRHVIGYDVQKVLAAADGLKDRGGKVGVAGYGEGGLIAFYAAAVEPRIDAALVSGYFDSRQRVWEEPIYRNVWGLLREFGDAEIASLIAPRGLVVEHSGGPKIDGPPPVPPGRRGGAAAGKLSPPGFETVAAEFRRIDELAPRDLQQRSLIFEPPGRPVDAGSPRALREFAAELGVESRMDLSGTPPVDLRKDFDPLAREQRQVKELENHVQHLLRVADHTRNAFFLDTTSLMRGLESRGQRFRMERVATRSPETFTEEAKKYRKTLWEDVLGRLDDPPLPPNPRTRKIYDRAKWVGYDVVLDLFPDVFAWGLLLVPKDLKPGDRRPVVVCQHGRNGLPKETVEGGSWAYRDFAAKLADRGFVTFSPHNLYRGEDLYRILNRKANAVKTSMFSFIIAQHQQILEWLGTLPFVDPARVAFYGLSYGGETAVRVPTILEPYRLSICSGDFNDWARKVASTESDYSFMFTVEWEMPYFNMGSTFNYAELAYLMVPRPFMVERGHHDGVAPDEWVSYEYAKVRWLYAQLGLGDRTEIEFYNGGHIINGEATFDFLHKHLKWPKP